MTQIKECKYIILGAGPSGLSLAHALLDQGCSLEDMVILEKEREAGGLCRSESVDGSPIDIGGGHFLDIKRVDVLAFMFRFLPQSEWNTFKRISKIRLRDVEIDHPIEANLWQLPIEDQLDYLESIAVAGSASGVPMPESFEDYIRWKLGDRIAEDYMLPYNRKIWSINLEQLGTYWLHKLPNVSFRETLQSCIQAKSTGSLPAHGTFLYPKEFGYGEVWKRMGQSLGESLILDCSIEHIDLSTLTVNGKWKAKTIISTVPWTLWPNFCSLGNEVNAAIALLQKSSVDVRYQPETLDSPAHWIYEPDETISYHRLLLRSNFFSGARGHWTETTSCRSPEISPGNRVFRNEFAYPINTLEKPQAIARVLEWARSKGILGLGRWGKWEHMNSDVAVAEALQLAKDLTGGVQQ